MLVVMLLQNKDSMRVLECMCDPISETRHNICRNSTYMQICLCLHFHQNFMHLRFTFQSKISERKILRRERENMREREQNKKFSASIMLHKK